MEADIIILMFPVYSFAEFLYFHGGGGGGGV